jgi:amino acid transporter
MTFNPSTPQITNYKQELGFLETTSIVIGRIIGSGIFRTPGPIMALVSSTSMFGLVWIAGGLTAILASLCYAELVAMMPKTGGPYIYLKEAYPPIVSFLRGWAMFFVSETGAIVAVALVLAEYSNTFASAAFGIGLDARGQFAISLGAIWLLTFANCFGIHASGIIQNLISFIKILTIFALVQLSFLSSAGNTDNFFRPLIPTGFSISLILSLGQAMRYSFFAFTGWEGATYIAEEVKNPARNLPLSLIIGIGCVILLYLAANSAYIYLLPVKSMKTSKWVAADAMKSSYGLVGMAFISAAIIINTFGNVGTQILCKARTWQAMAGDGLFFAFFRPLSKKYSTPNRSLIGQGLWATVLLIFASRSRHGYESIIDFFFATGCVFNILIFLSVHILRKKCPNMPRPFKAWLYPSSMIILIAIYSILLIIALITAFLPSMSGFILTLTGLLYYHRAKIKLLFSRRST